MERVGSALVSQRHARKQAHQSTTLMLEFSILSDECLCLTNAAY
jgi:hypothetical protein